jgi:hypothetical protein
MMPDWFTRTIKRFRFGPYELAALGIIAFASGLRIYLTAKGWPASDSDEGTMGLEAMHIAFRGEHPIFLYGQHYMGTIEAYIGALLFRLLGVSLFALRLGMMLLFTFFLISMYFLTSLLFTKRYALCILALLSVGAINIILPELRAVGGAEDTLVFGTLSLLLSTWLALTSNQDQVPVQRWKRPVTYGLWGLAVGLGIWSHLLIAPFALAGGLILLLFCRREWRTLALPCILIGFIIGAFPLIYYNLTAPLSQNSLATALMIQSATNTGIPLNEVPFLKQVAGTFLYSLPIATGFSPICNLQALPLYTTGNAPNIPCAVVQGGWSLGYCLLLFTSAVMAVMPLWKAWQYYRSKPAQWSEEVRQTAIVHFARLMLLLAGAITILLYLKSPLSAEAPWSTRYLIGLLVVLPAVIWPLWHGVRTINKQTSARALRTALRFAMIFLIGLTFLVGTFTIFGEIPGAEASQQQDAALIHDLSQHGITHIYSDYWTCDRIVFASQEHIICGVVFTSLKPGLNRYAPYYQIVSSDPRSSYVFHQDSEFSAAAANNPFFSNVRFRHFTLDGYIIYQPK